MAPIRSFVAIELTPGIRNRLEEIQKELKSSTTDVRWVRVEGIHLTLKFLGSVKEDKIPLITDVLEECSAVCSPFHLTVRTLGAFPSNTNPKVIWIGVEEEGNMLQALQETLEKKLSTIGFKTEKREFTPHLTLGRLKSPKGKRNLVQRLEDLRHCECGTFDVEEISLFKSDLRPQGAVYTRLQSFTLKATAN